MEERAPDLVREATRLLPVQRIAEIFQRLAQEQVSIRDLRSILEAVIEWSPKEKDTVMLTEYVRGALKRQISYMYSRRAEHAAGHSHGPLGGGDHPQIHTPDFGRSLSGARPGYHAPLRRSRDGGRGRLPQTSADARTAGQHG